MKQANQAEVFTGKDVDEAIAAGLAALNLTRGDVQVEVLDEGSRGVLGIGSRPASVRLIATAEPEPQPLPEVDLPEESVPFQPPVPEPPQPPQPPMEDAEGISRDVLTELLDLMGFEAEIEAFRAEPSPDEDEESPLVLDIHGPDVDSLIGRKGETLAALQRIVRLIVGNRLTERANLVVDVSSYKQEREQKLTRLAERMAQRAVDSGRTVTLEPMPAYERRIIHVALRNRSDVSTESVGEGHRRRVTIVPSLGK